MDLSGRLWGAKGALKGALLWLCVWGAFAGRCQAGGGPENVFLVVNARSWGSRTVANHYIQLRQIPSSNVFFLDWGSYPEGLPTEFFRQGILRPILAEISRRKLQGQIDHIVYSTDFPHRWNCAADLQNAGVPAAVAPMASLTGLTTLYERVLDPQHAYHHPIANRYARGELIAEGDISTIGFRQWLGWKEDGVPSETDGEHYVLSTALGVSYGRGNSVQQILNYLTRSAEADGTSPEGTIYYVAMPGEVRSTVRRHGLQGETEDRFQLAMNALQAEGVNAEILTGAVPKKKQDVAGAMLGVPRFDWEASGSELLPGAICENFTSWGGVLSEEVAAAEQTPLSVPLKFGAAGSSGTVGEPLASTFKFPTSAIQLHYVRGCCLAESFYQAVSSPYQLLVVGDPLCQPWAKTHALQVTGSDFSKPLTGSVSITPSSEEGWFTHFEIFLDGVRRANVAPGGSYALPTDKLPDGPHELRVVGISKDLLQIQSRWVKTIFLSNHQRVCQLSAVGSVTLPWGETLNLKLTAPGAAEIRLFCQQALAGTLGESQGTLTFATKEWGQGPLELYAVAYDAQNQPWAVSNTLRVQVESAPPLLNGGLRAASPANNPSRRGGLTLKRTGNTIPINSTLEPDWFSKSGVAAKEAFELQGWVKAGAAGDHQFYLGFAGDLELLLNEVSLYAAKNQPLEFQHVAVNLLPGWHLLTVRGKTGPDAPHLTLHYGGPDTGVGYLGPHNTRQP